MVIFTITMPACIEKPLLDQILFCSTQPSWCAGASITKIVITNQDEGCHRIYYGWDNHQLCVSQQRYRYSNTWTAYDRYLDYNRIEILHRVSTYGYAVIEFNGSESHVINE